MVGQEVWERRERGIVGSDDGNIPYPEMPYDMGPFNTAIGRNDITPVPQTAAKKLS